MSSGTAETSHIPPVDGQGGLSSRSFTGLLITQFLGAVNDNMFRWLVVPIGKEIVGEEKAGAALAVGLACFVLPYLLLAAYAGYLADRFSKRTVIVGCKVAELVIMVLGVGAILIGELNLMFVVVALMGSQSALFGPSKLGSIPEIVRTDRISAANGLIGMTTVLAIVVGTVAGNFLYELTRPLGQENWWISAAALIGVASAGLMTSLLIAPLRSANPARKFPVDAPRQIFRDLAALGSRRPLLRAAMGCAVFWGLGALAQMNVDLFVITELFGKQLDVGVMLAMLAAGVGVGSVLAGILSAGRVELGIVSLGAAGIAASSMLLFAVPDSHSGVPSFAYVWTCGWLLMLGVSAGLYSIPIQAFLQHHSPRESRGSILAATNVLANSAMLTSAGLFWLGRDVLGMEARQIFLGLGLFTIPVLVYIVWLLPGATVRVVVWLLSHTIYRVRVEGRENLPKKGGALLVANHASWIDGVLLILHSPRPIRMVAYADYMQKWWLRRLAADMGTIQIKPGKRSVVESIRAAREAIKDGDLVCIFPEGRITRDGRMGEFRPGFLSMLKNTDAPLIPIHLGGLWGSIFSYERGRMFWKWPKRWPYPVSIRIGRPMSKATGVEETRQAVVELGEES